MLAASLSQPACIKKGPGKMFIVIRNLSNGENFVAECRISPPLARVRAAILREVDGIMMTRPNWRRGFTYNMFFCTRENGGFYRLDEMFQLTKDIRFKHGFIKVYIDEKSLTTLASDQRRLAIAMALHPRLGDHCLLGCVDTMVLHLVLAFAGL